MSNLVRSGAAVSRRLAIVGIMAALVAAVVGCGGGGGGGGGNGGGPGGNPVTVTGKVLRAETGLAPSPAATVTVGGVSATTGTDGSFTLSNVGSNANSVTVAAQGAQTLTQTVSLANPTSGVVNLGTLYTSDTGYTAVVTGTVVVQGATQQPVAGAVVTLAGLSATTHTDGTFTISNLPVGLGNVTGEAVGQITATGFVTKPLTSDTLQFGLGAGTNALGVIPISSAQISTTSPPPPYTITGFVTVGGKVPTSPVTVALIQNGGVLGTTTTDSTGAYYFWVVPGSYTLTANQSSNSQSKVVTLNSLTTPVTVPTFAF